MQVKGLEIAAYNCKFIPGMALAFGVSPIGAHHKESWIITFEVKQTTRESYGRDKAQKVVDLQRIRGGLFESIVTCRFPWVELGWGVENYPKYFNTITGQRLDARRLLADLRPDLRADQALLAARVPARPTARPTIPPAVWFDPANADTEGPIAGKHPRARQVRRAAPALLRHPRLRHARHPDPGHPGAARARRRGRRCGGVRDAPLTMKVTVKLAGGLVHTLGFSERQLEVPPGTTVAELLDAVGIDRTRPMIVGRNGWAIGPHEALQDGDRILVSPVFSGG